MSDVGTLNAQLTGNRYTFKGDNCQNCFVALWKGVYSIKKELAPRRSNPGSKYLGQKDLLNMITTVVSLGGKGEKLFH